MKIIKKRHLHSLLAVLLLICSMTACANTPAKVEIPEISGVNACNYIAWNEMDCSDGYLALYSEQLLGTTLTVYDADGRVARISNASQSFRLCGTDLFYIKSDRLMRQNLPDGYTMEIAREAASFVVHKDKLYYCTIPVYNDAADAYVNRVCQYDRNTDTHRTLYENVQQVFVHRNQLYIVDMEDRLLLCHESGQTEPVLQLDPDVRPYEVFPQGDHLLMLDMVQNLVFISMETGKTERLSIVENAGANDRAYLICDETQIFFSYHATRTNGSIVTDIESENNGVWQINAETKEVRKISDTYFHSLYLCDGILWGVSDGEISRIAVPSGGTGALV